ncbi:MAG: hypothetical protein EOL90_07330 [Spartobacteria bacterium]|nr:hypothetical protein [Spartobacteria bacterium]
MNKFVLIALGLLAAGISAPAGEKVFALATAGEVDAAFAERVRARLEEHAGAAVRMAPAIPLEAGQSLEAIGRAAAATLTEADHSILVLVRPSDDQPQGVCLPHERFAALNVAKLEAGADAEHVERRAVQEGQRVMSMLLKMAPCPFPLCVLVGYEKVEDLDRMSGNFCPPCQDRFTRYAREADLRLVEPAAEEVAPAVEPAPAADEAAPGVE